MDIIARCEMLYGFELQMVELADLISKWYHDVSEE
jgi:hypothetical protein